MNKTLNNHELTLARGSSEALTYSFFPEHSVEQPVSWHSSDTNIVKVAERARLGERDQWLNLVSGIRYIYGRHLSGFQVPILLNANLLKMDWGSAYLGGGFEFDFFGRYLGCMKYQIGLACDHLDFRFFYKPYQGDLGVGVTYYF